MKIYKLTPTTPQDSYYCCLSCIVIAPNEKSARNIHPLRTENEYTPEEANTPEKYFNYYAREWVSWKDREKLSVEYLGEYAGAQNPAENPVILASLYDD